MRLLQAGKHLSSPSAIICPAQSHFSNLNCTSKSKSGEGPTCVVPCFPPSWNINYIYDLQFSFGRYTTHYNTWVWGSSIMPLDAPLQAELENGALFYFLSQNWGRGLHFWYHNASQRRRMFHELEFVALDYRSHDPLQRCACAPGHCPCS